jgi:hypothetical protein
VAEASKKIAAAQYEKAIQTAFREVSDALVSRESLVEQLRAQQAQLEAESSRLNLSNLRYTNGVASYLDLLDAQRSLFTLEQAVVQVRLAQLQNQVLLYKALGGGWTEASRPQQPRRCSTGAIRRSSAAAQPARRHPDKALAPARGLVVLWPRCRLLDPPHDKCGHRVNPWRCQWLAHRRSI